MGSKRQLGRDVCSRRGDFGAASESSRNVKSGLETVTYVTGDMYAHQIALLLFAADLQYATAQALHTAPAYRGEPS